MRWIGHEIFSMGARQTSKHRIPTLLHKYAAKWLKLITSLKPRHFGKNGWFNQLAATFAPGTKHLGLTGSIHSPYLFFLRSKLKTATEGPSATGSFKCSLYPSLALILLVRREIGRASIAAASNLIIEHELITLVDFYCALGMRWKILSIYLPILSTNSLSFGTT